MCHIVWIRHGQERRWPEFPRGVASARRHREGCLRLCGRRGKATHCEVYGRHRRLQGRVGRGGPRPRWICSSFGARRPCRANLQSAATTSAAAATTTSLPSTSSSTTAAAAAASLPCPSTTGQLWRPTSGRIHSRGQSRSLCSTTTSATAASGRSNHLSRSLSAAQLLGGHLRGRRHAHLALCFADLCATSYCCCSQPASRLHCHPSSASTYPGAGASRSCGLVASCLVSVARFARLELRRLGAPRTARVDHLGSARDQQGIAQLQHRHHPGLVSLSLLLRFFVSVSLFDVLRLLSQPSFDLLSQSNNNSLLVSMSLCGCE